MGVKLPDHKTKIVCTIGPVSRSETVLEELMRREMNVARLNFVHGILEGHREDIRRIRFAAEVRRIRSRSSKCTRIYLLVKGDEWPMVLWNESATS